MYILFIFSDLFRLFKTTKFLMNSFAHIFSAALPLAPHISPLPRYTVHDPTHRPPLSSFHPLIISSRLYLASILPLYSTLS